MEGKNDAAQRLVELKIEARNITRLMSNVRRIHPSKWMKRVRHDLLDLLNSQSPVSEAIMTGCLLLKLKEAIDSMDAAMNISRSEQLAHAREYTVRILDRFSEDILIRK